jgi:dihydropteroate synthase
MVEAAAADSLASIATRHGEISLRRRTAVIGILNVTPDSFSDGGRYADADAAIARGIEMAEEGADAIDIGGESTRPGSEPVPAEEELRRVLPVLRGLRRVLSLPISVDTYKAEVARRALDEGADLVNDVSALRFDPEMAAVVARERVPVVLMHMQGTPRTMQLAPHYRDVTAEVAAFLRERVEAAVEAGIARERIILDPGIGFGKTLEHNLTLLRNLPSLASLGRPLLVGVSRKAFIGRILGVDADQRLEGSLAAAVAAVFGGAGLVRVHDVKETVRALKIADAIRFGAEAR